MKRTNGVMEQINVAKRATDPWEGISADVIRRFVDVLCAQHALPKEVLMAYHADLQSLDRWLIETKQRTLVSATDEDVREYISVSLSCLRAFYGFLVSSGISTGDA